MNVSDYLGDDGLVLLALCSAFGLPEGAAADGTAPFTLSEWNKLARQVHDSPLKRPAALQGRTSADLGRELSIAPDDAERVKGADKLLRLEVDLGTEVRQLVAGIAAAYGCSPSRKRSKRR